MLIVLCPTCNRYSRDGRRCQVCGANIGEIVTELLVPYDADVELEPDYALACDQ